MKRDWHGHSCCECLRECRHLNPEGCEMPETIKCATCTVADEVNPLAIKRAKMGTRGRILSARG